MSDPKQSKGAWSRQDPETSDLPLPAGSPHRSARGYGGTAIGVAIIVILLIVFVLQNSQPVSVHFFVTSGHPRLIWVIVFCTLIGAAIGYLLGRPAKRRSRGQKSSSDGGPLKL